MSEMKRIPIVIAVFLLILGGLGYYVNQILIKDLKETQQQIEGKESLLQVRKTELVAVQKLNQDFSAIEKKATLALEALPSEKQKPALFFQILSLADKNNIKVSSFSPADPPDSTTPGLKEIQINLAVQCSYEQALDFLDDLSTSMRLVNITAVSISAASAEEQTINLTLQAKTFFLPETSVQQPAEASSPAL
jgi:Tfp pilus assembly protein PilO